MTYGHHPGRRRGSNSTGSECSDGYSDRTGQSSSTAPTDTSQPRPTLRRWDTDISDYLAQCKGFPYEESLASSAADDTASILTYASTAPSEIDLAEDGTEYPVYDECFEEEYDDQEPAAYPSTPAEFAAYFPSTRRLTIRHDDTFDGNMNLRVDADVLGADGRRLDLTLFHLRMHDLKHREFSLRRYCRSSGREVCHSSRKFTAPASARRPALSRSMTSALASFRPKTSDAKMQTRTSLKRTDSGYDSMSEDGDEPTSPQSKLANLPVPTNTTNIEFSNYAHVELKRRGAKSSKRYEFDYWGRSYTWRRSTRKNGDRLEVSYHLYNSFSPKPVAHVVPIAMTSDELEEEEAKGGWIPPSTIWISDLDNFGRLADVADVIVSTGLMALVDDSIKLRWHRKDRFHFAVPLPSINKEYIDPKKLIDEVFNRRGQHSTRRSPIRQATA